MHEPAKSSKLNISSEFRLFPAGNKALDEMLLAIDAAQYSIRLEMYIINESPIAESFRTALVNACRRGLHVQVLVDAMGSITLPESFWDPVKNSGGEFRWFNPLTLRRIGLRDHRKILVCDEETAFIGGFNISTEYTGDGVTNGWRDLGLKVCGPLARELARAFEEMFHLADFRHKRFARLRRSPHQKAVWTPDASLLLSAPGRQRNPMKRALNDDFDRAKKIQIISAYFLPTWRLRLALSRIVRRGGQVQLILPAKSDVPLMRLASQGFYRRLLRAGVEIYEYEPQILHAKLIVLDESVVYAGSANLDIRSLQLNYELLVRLENKKLAGEASEMFQNDLKHCRKIELHSWVKSRTLWGRIKSRLAYLILARLDPYVASWQLKKLRFRQKKRL